MYAHTWLIVERAVGPMFTCYLKDSHILRYSKTACYVRYAKVARLGNVFAIIRRRSCVGCVLGSDGRPGGRYDAVCVVKRLPSGIL